MWEWEREREIFTPKLVSTACVKSFQLFTIVKCLQTMNDAEKYLSDLKLLKVKKKLKLQNQNCFIGLTPIEEI